LAVLTNRFYHVRVTMVIFDYHGEYSELNVPTVVHVPAKINPRHVDSDKLADLLDVRENATIQRSVLHEAFTDEVKLSTEFWNALLAAVMEIAKNNKDAKKRAAERVYDIIGTSMRRMRRVLDPDIANPLDQIKPNHVNVLNMLELTERQAGIVIAHNLEELLEDRKRARQSRWAKREEGIKAKFMAPVVCAIEEAHAFIPNNEDTEAKYVASKVAREGRKFGLSLIIVSQRPSRVDQDVLSQMSSLAVLRISQPQDQDYIVDASEIVSKELAAYLPSLNVGEAILLGQWVNLPSVTKIQRVEEKLMGADIIAVREWSENVELAYVAKEKTSDLIRDM